MEGGKESGGWRVSGFLLFLLFFIVIFRLRSWRRRVLILVQVFFEAAAGGRKIFFFLCFFWGNGGVGSGCSADKINKSGKTQRGKRIFPVLPFPPQGSYGSNISFSLSDLPPPFAFSSPASFIQLINFLFFLFRRFPPVSRRLEFP